MDKKTYTIFAGVNGVGKSTLYNGDYFNKSEFRINTDEIVNQIGDWRSQTDQMKAARIAVQNIKKYIEQGISFNQETTLAGKSMIQNIKKAKEHGFKVILNYIGIESPEVAKERVRQRVLKGGHSIPEEIIEKRYFQSIENLKEIIPLCDIVKIFDNTYRFTPIVVIEDNKVINEVVLEKATWLKEVIENDNAKENKQLSADDWNKVAQAKDICTLKDNKIIENIKKNDYER